MNENDEVTFKKYRLRGTVNGQESFELVPLNTDYPTLNSLHNKITILGTMLETSTVQEETTLKAERPFYTCNIMKFKIILNFLILIKIPLPFKLKIS